MAVFIVIALLAALLHVLLGALADLIGTAIAYAIAGLLCGLVLRTRLAGGVQRMLVVCFFAIGFASAGVWSTGMLATQATLVKLVPLWALAWGVVGLAASLPYLGPRWRLTVPLFAAACLAVAGGLSILLLYAGFGGLFVALLGLNPLLVCLGAGVFDQICASIGLESPQEGFERLRVRFEFRLR